MPTYNQNQSSSIEEHMGIKDNGSQYGRDSLADTQRLFVDMDGTLAVFHPVDTLEQLYEPGYFLNLEPMPNPIQAIKQIIREQPDIEVYILSSCLADSPYALDEKNAWLDQYLPEVPADHRVFPPCGADKKAFIPDGIRPNDYLLDDYTKNLLQWQPPARGIKLLNGINHTNGTWEHDRLWHKKDPSVLAQNIVDVMQGKERIQDQKPEKGITQQKKSIMQDVPLKI